MNMNVRVIHGHDAFVKYAATETTMPPPENDNIELSAIERAAGLCHFYPEDMIDPDSPTRIPYDLNGGGR